MSANTNPQRSGQLMITKELLRPWSPCADGYRWFLEKFPKGDASYEMVQKALRTDNRREDARWLTDKVWENLILNTPATVADVTADHKAEALELIESTQSLKVEIEAPAEGSADAEAAEDDGIEKIGSSGDYAQIGSSGDYVRIGSSGDSARIGSSGDYARIGSSGYSAQINATGEEAVICSAGLNVKARVGTTGVLALAWHDEAADRVRIAVGYVGEDLKADTWYEIVGGNFVEVAE